LKLEWLYRKRSRRHRQAFDELVAEAAQAITAAIDRAAAEIERS